MKQYLISLIAALTITACQNKPGSPDQSQAAANKKNAFIQDDSTLYESETLVIRKLSDHTFQHISYLNTEDFGRVSCNGMIVVNKGEAIVFDTPADSQSSVELIRYLSETMDCSIRAVVATHFHADCVAGLGEFHQNRIPSYASSRTLTLLKSTGDSVVIPQNSFEDILELSAGGKTVFAEFFGEGHTKDNIVVYYPEENVLFGGCLIKEVNAGKGNLADANEAAWAGTVKKIKKKYPEAAIVVPGHGEPGGAELLDYTIQLFGI
ncbi:MAG TPA: subclass B1 metallo-beta-lactamase [Anseongella sp.]|nr:subclass B1 metallo-beta-lactamase [Anseongella sp.]